MARMFVVAIYDIGVGAFLRPWYVRSQGEALRSFTDEVNRRATETNPAPMAAHPEDYQLFYLGMFDDEAGKFQLPPNPEKLADAASLVQKAQQDI